MSVDDNLADLPGARLVVEAERTPGAVVADAEALGLLRTLGLPATPRTLSADAMTRLVAEMGGFVASRMLRAMDAGRVPRRVTVHLFVELDGEAAE